MSSPSMSGLSSEIAQKIRWCGKILFEKGLIDTRSGNISVRRGKSIIIKKTGKSLPFLTKKDVISLPLYKESKRDKLGSSDLNLHRKIYIEAEKRRRNIGAVIHTHCPEAVALSFYEEKIVPSDYEAKYFIKEINFVDYDDVPYFISEYGVCVVKGHGTFAGGKNLDDALFLTLALAHSLKIEVIKRMIK